jgi:hypothetical protein
MKQVIFPLTPESRGDEVPNIREILQLFLEKEVIKES